LPQNVTTEFSIHHLSWWNKFLMHHAFSVKILLHFRLWFQSRLASLKQDLMQIHCSFTSVILAGQYNRKTALTWCHQSAQKKHVLTTERCLAEWLIKCTSHDTWRRTTVLQAVFTQHSNFGDLVTPCVCALCTVLVLPGADTKAVSQMRPCLLSCWHCC
jgi:hypothetical protein